MGEAVDELQCKKCGSDMERAHFVSVMYVTIKHRFEAEVPICGCTQCGTVQSISPMHVACMPGTPVQAWDLSTRSTSQPPSLWVSLELCALLDQLKLSVRRASMLKLWEVIDLTHHQNDPTLAPTKQTDSDRFRKTLTMVRPWPRLCLQTLPRIA